MKQRIKSILVPVLGALLFASATPTLKAWITAGYVYCDSNQNEQIDAGDTPIPGVLVVVTNISGTFSNANFTTTPDGGFVLELPSVPDTYVEYLHPLTLPGDAVGVLPPGGYHMFTLDGSTSNFLGNFLVSSPTCTNTPPPPPPQTNGCCLKASGTIGGKKSKPAFCFAGEAVPACACTNGDSGVWDVVAFNAKLHFEGCVLDIVNCGEVSVTNCAGSTKFIEFQGIGKLKGIAGCRADYGLVYFYARAEDRGKQGDSLYFRAYSAEGATLLLISGDMSDASHIVPLPLCTGDVKIGTDCCDRGDDDHDGDGHDGDDDDDHDGDNDHGGGKPGHGGHKGKGKGGGDNCNPGNGNGNGGDHGQGGGGNKGKGKGGSKGGRK